MEGMKLIEPVIVSGDEGDEEAFLADCNYSGILDDDINVMLECFINLIEIPDHVHNPLSFDCIYKQQQQDQKLLALQAKYPAQYV